MNINRWLSELINKPGLSIDDGSFTIGKKLQASNPLMVARFGANEIKAALYPMLPPLLRKFVTKSLGHRMEFNAGFFPAHEASLIKFSRLLCDDMRCLDVLGSWRAEELLLKSKYSEATMVPLKSLEPYLSTNPWSQALAGQRVLVIHPFSATIESQYFKHREKLFLDERVLPEFASLQTIKAVQSIAGSDAGYVDWFSALDYMKAEISKLQFDVAIIGCGAYGFSLAAHVKRLGRKSIHLGGATQLLFGIKGKRWDENKRVSPLYNSSWVRPCAEDVPQGAELVEQGCYW